MTSNNGLSIYIPRVPFDLANKDSIANALQFGEIDRIDFVFKAHFAQAFVHFKFWYPTAGNIYNVIFHPDMRMHWPVNIPGDNRYFILLPNKNPMTAKEVQLEQQLKKAEAELQKFKDNAWYPLPEQQLTPLWAHSEKNVDPTTTPEWLSATAADSMNINTLSETTSDMASTLFIQSDEYDQDYDHDNPYDMDILE